MFEDVTDSGFNLRKTRIKSVTQSDSFSLLNTVSTQWSGSAELSLPCSHQIKCEQLISHALLLMIFKNVGKCAILNNVIVESAISNFMQLSRVKCFLKSATLQFDKTCIKTFFSSKKLIISFLHPKAI